MIDFSKHAFKQYDAEVTGLLESLGRMGEHALSLLGVVADAVQQNDDAAARAKEIDKRINALEDEVNHQVQFIISRYQPIGDELRLIIGIVRVSAVLESIGDISKSCARRFVALQGIDAAITGKFKHLIQACVQTLDDAMRTINAFDRETARDIFERENHIDAEAGVLLDELRGMLHTNPAHIAELMMLVRDVERIGDQCYMIAKLEYYFETGDSPRNKNYKKLNTSE